MKDIENSNTKEVAAGHKKIGIKELTKSITK